MKTLEKILQEHFNCKKPFLAHPHYDEEEKVPVTLTKKGSEAYGNLISLLNDIGNLTGEDTSKIIEKLDEIASEL